MPELPKDQPEPCMATEDNGTGFRSVCRSPTACHGWGYCRERNIALGYAPDEYMIETWRRRAAKRKTDFEGKE